MSKRCQMWNSWTREEVHKKCLDKMSSTHNEVNYDVTYEGHQNWLKDILWIYWGFLMTIICNVSIYLIMYEPHCVKFFCGHCHHCLIFDTDISKWTCSLNILLNMYIHIYTCIHCTRLKTMGGGGGWAVWLFDTWYMHCNMIRVKCLSFSSKCIHQLQWTYSLKVWT